MKLVVLSQDPAAGCYFFADATDLNAEGLPRYIAMVSKASSLTFLDPCPSLTSNDLHVIADLLDSLNPASGERGLWWCEVHNRKATHTNPWGEPSCASELGGIMLPCKCRFVFDNDGYPRPAMPSPYTQFVPGESPAFEVVFPGASMAGKLYIPDKNKRPWF